MSECFLLDPSSLSPFGTTSSVLPSWPITTDRSHGKVIPNHCGRTRGGPEAAQEVNFLVRQQFRVELVDPCLPLHRSSHRAVVTAQRDSFRNPQTPKPSEALRDSLPLEYPHDFHGLSVCIHPRIEVDVRAESPKVGRGATPRENPQWIAIPGVLVPAFSWSLRLACRLVDVFIQRCRIGD